MILILSYFIYIFPRPSYIHQVESQSCGQRRLSGFERSQREDGERHASRPWFWGNILEVPRSAVKGFRETSYFLDEIGTSCIRGMLEISLQNHCALCSYIHLHSTFCHVPGHWQGETPCGQTGWKGDFFWSPYNMLLDHEMLYTEA